MSLSLIFEIFATSLVASGAAWATVVYLGKTLLTQKLAAELERHKNELGHELEAFKLDLEKELHKFSVEVSRLDQQRSVGVMEIHALMCEIEQLVIWNSGSAATSLISVAPETRSIEALNKAWENIAALNRSLNYHALLLSEDVYVGVQHWSKQMMLLVSSIGNEIEPLRKLASTSIISLQDREHAIAVIRDKHLDGLLAQLGETRKLLEQEFRRLLGASSDA
jgi:hypothetical protein